MADHQRTNERGTTDGLYELRTYTLHVGKMAEAVKLYQRDVTPRANKRYDRLKDMAQHFDTSEFTSPMTIVCLVAML